MIEIKKNPKLKYTDMCIYIDNTVYKNPDGSLTEQEKDTIFEYLFLLANMLASKKRYFYKFEDYSEFAFYAATRTYFRLVNKKQYDAYNPLPKIKSILNFLKNTLYVMKVDWQTKNFNEIIDSELTATDILEADIYESIKSDYSIGREEFVLDEIKTLPKLIRTDIQKTPYRNDKVLCEKLYMSVLLTFLDKYTLRNKYLSKLRSYVEKNKPIKDNTIFNYYDTEKLNEVILWKLDASWKDFVTLLYNKTNIKFIRNVAATYEQFKLPDNVVASILQAQLDDFYGSKGDSDEE